MEFKGTGLGVALLLCLSISCILWQQN